MRATVLRLSPLPHQSRAIAAGPHPELGAAQHLGHLSTHRLGLSSKEMIKGAGGLEVID